MQFLYNDIHESIVYNNDDELQKYNFLIHFFHINKLIISNSTVIKYIINYFIIKK